MTLLGFFAVLDTVAVTAFVYLVFGARKAVHRLTAELERVTRDRDWWCSIARHRIEQSTLRAIAEGRARVANLERRAGGQT